MRGTGPVVVSLVALGIFYLVVIGLRMAEPLLARTAVGTRIAKYMLIAIRSWTFGALVLVVVWAVEMRSGRGDLRAALEEIGLHARLSADQVGLWSAAMLVAASTVGTGISYLRNALGGKATNTGIEILPVTPTETAVFSLVVSPTAGINEEFIFRGFVMGQLWGITGDGWIAAALSSALFGLLHAYQGAWGIGRTGVIGFVFAIGVLMTGSLVPSIIAHTLVNMSGASFRVSQRAQDAADSGSA